MTDRELDYWIAEHVAASTLEEYGGVWWVVNSDIPYTLPHYSIQLMSAFSAVHAMLSTIREKTPIYYICDEALFTLSLLGNGRSKASIRRYGKWHDGVADIPAMAICLALKCAVQYLHEGE